MAGGHWQLRADCLSLVLPARQSAIRQHGFAPWDESAPAWLQNLQRPALPSRDGGYPPTN